MFRAVCLDFDGLVVDTETAYVDAVGDVHRAHQRLFDKRALTRAVGHVGMAVNLWAGFGPGAPVAALELERRRFLDQRLATMQPLPGVAELLAEARQRGLLVGCASNSPHDHVEGYLARYGLLERYDAIICREDVAAPKPAPDVYTTVLARLGVAPDEALALEDSGAGVTAARAAGLWVAAVPNPCTREHDLAAADARLASLGGVTLADLFAAVRAGRRTRTAGA